MTLSIAVSREYIFVYLPNDLAASRGKVNKFEKTGETSGTVVQTPLNEGYEIFIFSNPNQSRVYAQFLREMKQKKSIRNVQSRLIHRNIFSFDANF